jgi:hypothetical protein
MSESTQLAFTPGDATWTEWRKRALTDLYFFAGVVCKYGDAVTMTEGMHKLMCRVVERRTGVPEIDQCKYRMVLMPRGTGKSTLVSQAYVLQRICRDPEIAVLICNEKLENAKSFLTAIKHQFEQNELFRALFPELIPEDTKKIKWNEEEIVVPRKGGRKEPTIKCQGVGAALASQHPDLIIVDDMLSREAAENARIGEGHITGAINRWVAQLQPLLNQGYQPFPEIVFLGTRWFRGDSYEYVEEAFGYGQPRQTWSLGLKLPNGEVQSIPVHRKGDLVIFSRQAVENGRSAWPERPGYDVESLAKIRLTDPALYSANYQNDPSDEVTATFKESWLQFYDWSGERQIQFLDASAKMRSYLIDDLDLLILVDPGGFRTKKGSDRSRGAIIVTGTTPGDNPSHLLLDLFSDQVPYTAVAEKILAMMTRYPPRRCYIEVVGQQITFYDMVRRMAAERGLQVAFDKLEPKNEQKEARILELEPFFQRGLIRIGRGPAFHEFREQYRAWPTPRADLLDVLAYGTRVWRQPPMRKNDHSARQEMERQAYLARRGMQLQR